METRPVSPWRSPRLEREEPELLPPRMSGRQGHHLELVGDRRVKHGVGLGLERRALVDFMGDADDHTLADKDRTQLGDPTWALAQLESSERLPMDNLPRLAPLPGTAPAGTWRITNADTADADGRLAIFAIVVHEGQSLKPLGTGFYLQPHGGFATAAHVALEAQQRLATAPGSIGIARTLLNGRTRFLPIWKFFIHDTADVAFGIPAAEFVDDTTGQVINAKVLSLRDTSPDIGAAIGTFAYPLHRFIGDE